MSQIEEIPNTFQDAVDEMITHLGFAEAANGTETADDFVTANHFGAGRAIRNGWKLWDTESKSPLADDMRKLGYTHADDMSSAILKAAWYKFNDMEFNIEEDVEMYKQYWDNVDSVL